MDPIFVIGGGVGVVVALLAVLAFMRKSNAPGPQDRSAIDALLKSGEYGQAGALAMQQARYAEAIDYFVRAQQPARAAQAALRNGNIRRAAELYEVAGDHLRAAHNYEQAGLADKARELRALGKSIPPPDAKPGSMAPPAGPGAAPRSEAELAQAQQLAAQKAEALLAAGELRKAADVYREAELYDEAIHLYVNVLGAPGEAAPLLAARGLHERAAELYEMAGQRERAAAVWVQIAKAAVQPEIYVDRIERLSEKVAVAFLEDAVKAKPLTKDTAELHYRLADALGRKGVTERAIAIFVTIQEKVPKFRDVDARIVTLRSAAPAKPALPAPRETAVKVSGGGIAIDLSMEDISRIAMEAARAALEQAKRSSGPSAFAQTAVSRRPGAPPKTVTGLELAPLSVQLVDGQVRAARDGPSTDTLRRMIGKRTCDLQNIEVYYRLGLAHLAAGEFKEALAAFDAVEEASPGYRDAEKRAGAIRSWQSALGNRLSLVAQQGQAASPNRYQLRGELGRGGMAVVYRGVDEVLGRDVALKFLSESLSARNEMREMFQREARSVAQLNHPNIVTIYDFGVLEGRAFIAMEYVDGTTVGQMIDERGKLSVVESLRITVQVLSALEYAHGRQIVHRDIKPGNMMRTGSGLVKLMDFGLAKSLDTGPKTSVVAGTPAYMASEQFMGVPVDHRADLFAVGVSLYEMLTGKLPFQHLDRNRPPASVRDVEPTVPQLLDKIVLRALEDDREQRFQTAAAFAEPVRKILEAVDKLTAANAGL